MQLKLDTSKTYAIALEGGGAKGAYEIGAWKALEEAGIKYNAVSGTSVIVFIHFILPRFRAHNQSH